jgi:hypothetical protein
MKFVKVSSAVMVVACTLCARNGLADETSDGGSQNKAHSQSLFEAGLALMQAGNFVQACPKLAESQRLSPAGGTALNLASCLDQQGKIASAYAAYQEALSFARRANRKEREELAQARVAALGPRIPKVIIVREHPSDERRLVLDGYEVGAAALGSPLPLDPGVHHLTANNGSESNWQSTFAAPPEGQTMQVRVPRLEARAKPALPAGQTAGATLRPAAGEPHQEAAGADTLAYVLWGTGAAFGVAGLTTGILSLTHHSASRSYCDELGKCASERGIVLEKRANAFAWTANITLAAAAISLAIGTVVYLMAPKASAAKSEGRNTPYVRGTF